MRGKYNGFQNFIKEKCATATFVWCYAHRLNLVVAKAVGHSIDAVDLFGNLETLYNFICGSKKKVAFYEEAQSKYSSMKKGRRLKRVSSTRWMSHDHALEAVLNTFGAVIDTLEHTRENEGRDDHSIGHLAGCLLLYLLSKRFVLTAIWFQKLFNILSPLNTMLQIKDLDLAAVNGILEIQKNLKNLRQNNTAFNSLMVEVDNFIKENEDFVFSEWDAKRIRRKKQMPGEKAKDEPTIDIIEKFKIDTYIGSLDITMSYIDEYFNTKATHIYKDLALLTKKRIEEVKINSKAFPKDSFSEFCAIYGKFVDLTTLRTEYIQFSQVFNLFEKTEFLPVFQRQQHKIDSENISSESEIENQEVDENIFSTRTKLNVESIKNVFKIFRECHLASVFPTLNTTFKIALTLPVSSASTERSFSKLKLIKTRLRTTMSQQRLEDLMIISCERNTSISSDEILQDFAQQSTILMKKL